MLKMFVNMYTILFLILCMESDALLNGLNHTTSDLSQRIDQLEARVSALEGNHDNSVGPIAFTAFLSSTLEHVGDHQHIIFDNVVTNVGRGYNQVDGHFVATTRGVYAFFVVLMNTVGHSASIMLMRNGQWLGHMLADDSVDHHSSSTFATTVQLETGDQVWVQNEFSYSASKQIDGFNWSSFSGHLIQQN